MTSRGNRISNESLNLLTVECPYCEARWLAPGMSNSDTYVCKECGLTFVVRKPEHQASQPPARISRIE
jgi:DNA-directed RNA polymerase subunit RPC12/RpoP